MNKNLHKAKREKNDEFYTQLADIENELAHYRAHFMDKAVYCNCDDPRISNFFHYFSYNFKHLGLKKLISACYKNQKRDLFSDHKSERAIWLEYEGTEGSSVPHAEDIGLHTFKGDGDFRSEECVELLRQADIVVTNPPFSLFREYVAQLMEYGKKFLIIGNKNAITYKDTFSFIKENKLWIGNTPMGKDMLFDVPDKYAQVLIKSKKEGSSYRLVDGTVKARSQSIWFTNMDHKKRHEELILYKKFSSDKYPRYDNYDAIEVSKVKDIPIDYEGAIGVPITFLDKYNPEQFEIIWTSDRVGMGCLKA